MAQEPNRKLSHHLSHHQLTASVTSQAAAPATSQQQQQQQYHHSHQHLAQMSANLVHHNHSSSVSHLSSQQQQQQQQQDGLSVAIKTNKSAGNLLQQVGQGEAAQLDRSDSASLPSSSASTSESMFKTRGAGRERKRWLRMFGCGGSSAASATSAASSSAPSTASSSADANNARAQHQARHHRHHHHHHSNSHAHGHSRARAQSGSHPSLVLGARSGGGKRSARRQLAQTLLVIVLGALVCLALILYFKLFGFSISCSYYGKSSGAKQPSEGFNMKNGAEFYLGITEMLQAMDSTVDPCTDFYNYACGAWTRRHSIPADESRIDTFSVMRSDLGNKLKDLLEEDPDATDSEATLKAKTLYKSCVNESQIDKRGPEPLIQLLQTQFGGWPLLGLTAAQPAGADDVASSQATLINEANWVQLMATLRTYNNEIIIGQTVGSHEHNSSMHAIRLYPAGLGLPSADYYNASSRQFKAYEKYLISTAQLLKANNSNLMSDIRDVLEFETGLANISKPFERQGGATYHRMTIARLQKYTPAIDWDVYFKHAFPDVPINSTEQIGLYGLDFFMDIANLISATPNKKTVINYLLWRFVMNRVNNLGKQFADNQHEYAAEISGAKVQAPRHKVCVDYVNGNMGMAVSSLYVRRHFDAASKHQAEVMIANIRQAFLDILAQVDWMDQETRQEAIVKAKSMLQHIGFPLWIIDAAALDTEYQHLSFQSDAYFENVIQLIQSFAKETRQKLRQPSERDKWTVAPSIINAHYLRTKNLMSFPAGILQPPIYHTRYPKSLNYGGIGSIIGHEITHGFDNDGRHHDYQGNQRLWWHPNTIDRFIVRSQCMVRQYDDYNVEIRGENITVSGIRTLGENIADNGGLKEAFMAYKRYELDNGPEDSLPGLNLTHHQMFFIKFAQNWCQNMTPQSMMNALKTWRHPLGRFRVIGTLSNLNEFSTAFNCPASAPMNPSNKCKVW